jgi:hypothetical protein
MDKEIGEIGVRVTISSTSDSPLQTAMLCPAQQEAL